MGKQSRRRRQQARATTAAFDPTRKEVDATYCDNDDGTISAWWDDLPDAVFWADNLDLVAHFMGRVTRVFEAYEEARHDVSHEIGEQILAGQVSLADLEELGIPTRVIDGQYCTVATGLPHAMLLCPDVETLGKALARFLRIGFGSAVAKRTPKTVD